MIHVHTHLLWALKRTAIDLSGRDKGTFVVVHLTAFDVTEVSRTDPETHR